jgi:hypothetical protein
MLNRRPLEALLSALVIIAVAACSGAASPGSPAAASAAPAAAPSESGGSAAGGASQAAGGSTGGSVPDGGDLCALLGPGDFAAAGVSGAGSPTSNPIVNDVQAADYCVYAKNSAAGGGIELDVFVLTSADAALTDFGGVAMYAIEPSAVTALGADQAGIYLEQLGNDAGTTFDQLRALKGRMWFSLAFPSNPGSRDQLLGLAKLVLDRGAALE